VSSCTKSISWSDISNSLHVVSEVVFRALLLEIPAISRASPPGYVLSPFFFSGFLTIDYIARFRLVLSLYCEFLVGPEALLPAPFAFSVFWFQAFSVPPSAGPSVKICPHLACFFCFGQRRVSLPDCPQAGSLEDSSPAVCVRFLLFEMTSVTRVDFPVCLSPFHDPCYDSLPLQLVASFSGREYVFSRYRLLRFFLLWRSIVHRFGLCPLFSPLFFVFFFSRRW